MKIGCSVINESEVCIAKDAGYDYVEFKGKYLAAASEGTLLDVRSVLRDTGMVSYGINAYCGPEIQMAGPEYSTKKAREYAAKIADITSFLGTDVIGLGSPFSRRIDKASDRKEALKQMEEFVAVTAEVFAPYGVTVCLEPLAEVYCDLVNTVYEAAEMIKKIPLQNLSVIVDFYSMELGSDSDLDIYPFMSRIGHVHMSDDLGNPYQRSYLLPVRKKIHQSRVRELQKMGYKGNITLEMDMPCDLRRAKESLDILKS